MIIQCRGARGPDSKVQMHLEQILVPECSYELWSIKGVLLGISTGVINRDIRRLDYVSYTSDGETSSQGFSGDV